MIVQSFVGGSWTAMHMSGLPCQSGGHSSLNPRMGSNCFVSFWARTYHVNDADAIVKLPRKAQTSPLHHVKGM